MHGLTLVFTDIATANDFFVLRPSPLIHTIRHLNLSFQVRDMDGYCMGVRPKNYHARTRWRSTFEALGKLKSLAEVYLWLDTTERRRCRFGDRGSLALYRFDASVAPILTVSIPVSEVADMTWLTSLAPYLPAFQLHRRGSSKYRVNSRGRLQDLNEE